MDETEAKIFFWICFSGAKQAIEIIPRWVLWNKLFMEAIMNVAVLMSELKRKKPRSILNSPRKKTKIEGQGMNNVSQ